MAVFIEIQSFDADDAVVAVPCPQRMPVIDDVILILPRPFDDGMSSCEITFRCLVQ